MPSNSGILLKDVFDSKLLNNLLACFLMNLDFLLSHNAYFDKSIVFSLFAFAT